MATLYYVHDRGGGHDHLVTHHVTISNRIWHALTAVPRTLHTWYTRHTERMSLENDLLSQPDSVLHDVGLTRYDVMREVRKPFWEA